MRDYYERTSMLYNLGNTLCNRLCGSGKQPAKFAFLPLGAGHREEFDGFALENGELELMPNISLTDEPLRLVRVFLLMP